MYNVFGLCLLHAMCKSLTNTRQNTELSLIDNYYINNVTLQPKVLFRGSN